MIFGETSISGRGSGRWPKPLHRWRPAPETMHHGCSIPLPPERASFLLAKKRGWAQVSISHSLPVRPPPPVLWCRPVHLAYPLCWLLPLLPPLWLLLLPALWKSGRQTAGAAVAAGQGGWGRQPRLPLPGHHPALPGRHFASSTAAASAP